MVRKNLYEKHRHGDRTSEPVLSILLDNSILPDVVLTRKELYHIWYKNETVGIDRSEYSANEGRAGIDRGEYSANEGRDLGNGGRGDVAISSGAICLLKFSQGKNSPQIPRVGPRLADRPPAPLRGLDPPPPPPVLRTGGGGSTCAALQHRGRGGGGAPLRGAAPWRWDLDGDLRTRAHSVSA